MNDNAVKCAILLLLHQRMPNMPIISFAHALQVHIVERIPWHEALWFVTTTLTTGALPTRL